ncbi:transposase [Mesorhizobium sp.]|uniref:IS1634 family transposase n=1 Tax=Mesorhizobium sp. TaxID=1871066 RepID=UPI0034507725
MPGRQARFGIKRVVLIGDRGMITSARIRDDLKTSSLDWITCLRAPQIQVLAQGDGPLQLSLFDERDFAEISSPDFPGERLIMCRNRDLAMERARKREALLKATERQLARVQANVAARVQPCAVPRRSRLAVAEVVNAKKVAKHFALDIRDGHFSWSRKIEQIAAEAELDGIYVIRTSVPKGELSAQNAVQAYKDLARVERAFRGLKTVDLEIRPIRHWNANRVRAHVFLCMLAYHVEWHLRQRLAPLLFHDTEFDRARRANITGRIDRAVSDARSPKRQSSATPTAIPSTASPD